MRHLFITLLAFLFFCEGKLEIVVSSCESESSLQYWTLERLNSAQPKSVSVMKEIPVGFTGPNGPEVAIPGSRGNSSMLGGPVDSTKYPYTTAGRLYFTQAGNNYWAAASSVQSATIITTGDSVYDFGGFSTNVVYYPSFPNYVYAYAVDILYAYTGWTQGYLQQYNYGMATTRTSGAFNPTGWAGLKWNVPLVNGLLWRQVGYLSGGSVMVEEYGAIVLPPPVVVTGTQTINNAGGTYLGNAWWNETSPSFFVNGVTAYSVSAHPTLRYSPYFDTSVGDLFYYVTARQP